MRLMTHAANIGTPSQFTLRPKNFPSYLRCACPMSLFRHLIPVIIFSRKIPIARSLFKESVKVCTPKSPPSANDSAHELAFMHILPHCARMQAQHFRSFFERQQMLPDGLGRRYTFAFDVPASVNIRKCSSALRGDFSPVNGPRRPQHRIACMARSRCRVEASHLH